MWRASVLTLFSEMFPGPLSVSLAGRALESKIWSLDVHDIKAHGIGAHRKVDDSPAGGGPGMVMRADVAAAAIDAAHGADDPRPLIYLTPRGAPLTQKRVRDLVDGPGVALFCARFEGLDERAASARKMEEISLGDFVLAGGEIAAAALLEACVRLLPGVMGAENSAVEESFETGLLGISPLHPAPDFRRRADPRCLKFGQPWRNSALAARNGGKPDKNPPPGPFRPL